MVDVTDKSDSDRIATAEGELRMRPGTLQALQTQATPKGDPLVVARIAGIQAAKQTAALIPLCHPLSPTHIDVTLTVDPEVPGIRAQATIRVRARTGAEMEALTAVAVALLTAYDMLKGVEKGMVIERIRLVRKQGGKGGSWSAGEADPED
ncbi:MAG: cyclic pyranopterin monophosphate synthase MoaC [Gemmatimonadetes bacterium]|nr:cyclic pyranopterin monophosphate synthase MoaC [Gemmatimonadota bacterium]